MNFRVGIQQTTVCHGYVTVEAESAEEALMALRTDWMAGRRFWQHASQADNSCGRDAIVTSLVANESDLIDVPITITEERRSNEARHPAAIRSEARRQFGGEA